MACAGALFALTGCHSNDPHYASTLVSGDYSQLASTEQTLLSNYSGGEWMPSLYSTSSWEQYQSAAAGEAVLGALPGGTAAERQVAIDTVNRVIFVHQMSDGDFDNGTPASGTSDVLGPDWAEIEGLIALELKPYLDSSTLASWTASMEHYVAYLKSSGNMMWYSNGNQVLRHALVALETNLLSGSATDAQNYNTAMQFALDPTMGGDIPQWSDYGLTYSTVPNNPDGSDGSGYLTESADGGHPSTPAQCANGQSPCNGFDPYYTMLQLNDALVGYAISDDPQWLSVVNLETNQLMPLVNRNTWVLNTANGSRDNTDGDLLYPQVFGIFDEHNLRADLSPATSWPSQLQPLSQEFSYYRTQSDPGPSAFALVVSLAIPLIDAQRVEGDVPAQPADHTHAQRPAVASSDLAVLRQIIPHGQAATIKHLVRNRGYALSLDALTAGKATIDWYVAPKAANPGKNAAKTLLVATGHKSFASASVAKLRIKLTPSGRRLLRHAKRLELTAKGAFTPTGGTAIVARETFRLTD